MRADLRYASWNPDGLVIGGWVTVDGPRKRAPSEIELLGRPLNGDATETPAEWPRLASVTLSKDHLDINRFLKSEGDPRGAAFTVLLPTSTWDVHPTDDFQVVVRYGSSKDVTPLTHRYRWGSAGHLRAQVKPPYRYAPRWDSQLGLCVSRTQPTVFAVERPFLHDQEVRIKLLTSHGYEPVAAHLQQKSESKSTSIPLHSSAGDVWLSIPHRLIPEDNGAWVLSVSDSSGQRRLVHWSDTSWDRIPIGLQTYLQRREGGLLRLVCGDIPYFADRVESEGGHLFVTVASDFPDTVNALVLRGPRTSLVGQRTAPNCFSFELACDSWGHTVPAPPSGGYRLFAQELDGSEHAVQPSPSSSALTPCVYRTQFATLRFEHAPDKQIYFDIRAPLRVDEEGPFNRRRLAALYTGPVTDTERRRFTGVFLESWYGKTFSDNPAPLVSALGRANVPGPYYAAIEDWSVIHPKGVVPIIVGSESYWEALGTSRVIVVNTWLPNDFEKQDGQYIVQTWHGTPLKTLGVDVPHRIGSEASARNLKKGSEKWNLLLSQSPYASKIFRRAYLYDGEIAEVGYPRNDLLARSTSIELRNAIRDKLGIERSAKVILYAPTWRQEDKSVVGPLNIRQLLELLPTDYCVAVRGHSVTLRRGSDVAGDRMIDVTSYPDLSDLIAMSDVLVTDYSSIMFDYAASGRPILYFTPDYEDYAEAGRGMYFSLSDSAPGPLTRTPEDLAEAVVASIGREPSKNYRLWQRRFVPKDDGGAAQRLAELISHKIDSKSSGSSS